MKVVEALRGSSALLGRAASEGKTYGAVVQIEGPAVVLGRHQVASRVLGELACADLPCVVARRASSGTAAFVGERGLFVSLALPDVAALFADASPRVLLNRNVRPLLRALRRAGLAGSYFGREWLSAGREPVALVGFEQVGPVGAVLLELVFHGPGCAALAERVSCAEERALDRARGHALCELEPARLDELEAKITEELTSLEVTLVSGAELVGAPTSSTGAGLVTSPREPVPEGLELEAPRRVPIGHLEVARGERRVWLGGDVLAPTWVLRALERGRPVSDVLAPIEGARLDDLLAALGPEPEAGAR